jgi:hypothetical protein
VVPGVGKKDVTIGKRYLEREEREREMTSPFRDTENGREK